MNRYRFFILQICAALVSCGLASAQSTTKSVHYREQIWLGYFNQTRLTNKWGMWMEVQYRQTDNFVERPFQLLVRPAVSFFIKDNLRVTTGYAFIEHFPALGLSTARHEHRIWQQILWSQKYSGFTTLQWLRLEQRFNQKVVNDVLQEGYNFTNRLRYNFSFSIPLKGKEIVARTPFAVVANEVFLNFGKNVVYNTFDQNRLFVGMGYQFTSQLNAQLGYMNVYQQEASGSNYNSANVIRFVVLQTLDLRKKK